MRMHREDSDQIDMAQAHRACRALLRSVGIDPDDPPYQWRNDEFWVGDRRIAEQRFDQRLFEIKEGRAGRM